MVWKIVSTILVILALLLWAALVWFALPLVGVGEVRPFEAIWVRVLMISVVWLIVGIVYLIKWIRRRRAAKALEAEIAEEQITGDGEILGEKMTEAMDVLKKSTGSKSFLYELPWYVIIGPPGAGKTTALKNSGIKFPLEEQGKGLVQKGVGGTRYVEWMFSEEAVLIDTAGRYAMQDSDAEADKESWLSFLRLLKTHRKNQPINGIILAISLQDIMTATETELELHADTIRKRLRELHEELKIEFPVYVMFTKADLISGFMEYFGAFSASRRQKVWGHTFQTENKKAQTVARFSEEYDLLVERLSEEVTDRLQEEPDGINRIAIFGFPGQVAMLRDRLDTFMRGIFAHTRYKTNATFRGFYFTSGTQEGTPIDQVLGAMDRTSGAQGMSGKGKSYFLHDLLARVIFPEAGWVSTDRKAVRRQKVLRIGGFVGVTMAALAMLGLWGYSFYRNQQLIRTAEAAILDYELAAKEELEVERLESIDLLEVLPYLDMIRDMPLGYGDEAEEGSITERFGLGQRERLQAAAESSYRQALERMFRSRLILRLEEEVAQDVREGEVLATYESLKTYKLLGGLGDKFVKAKDKDEFIRAWFSDDWEQNLYPGPQNRPNREAMATHLEAMLELDVGREPSFELNGALIDEAERLLARMNVAEQAYTLITSTIEFAPIEPFSIIQRAGRDAELVFETIDGSDLSTQVVPALYTYAGFHDFFLPQLTEISEALKAEQWVLGPYAGDANLDEQVQRVGPILVSRFTNEWIAAWDKVIDNLRMRPMAADRPAYQALLAASNIQSSPLLKLAQGITTETRLTQEFEGGDEEAGLIPDAGLNDQQGRLVDREIERGLSARQRTLKNFLDAFGSGKSGNRPGAGESRPLPGAEIEAYFTDWHTFVEGDPPGRQIDALLGALGDIQQLLVVGDADPNQAAGLLTPKVGALISASSRLPAPVARMIDRPIKEFSNVEEGTKLKVLRDQMSAEVTLQCEQIIGNSYPFFRTSSRDVNMADFGRLFSPGGVMDQFFNTRLAPLVELRGRSLAWRSTAPNGGDLSNQTLKQFERAQAIRDAFFGGGGTVPNIQMSVAPVDVHRDIRSAILTINGQVITIRRRGNQRETITWPGTSGAGAVELQLQPDRRGRESRLVFNGIWALKRYFDAGSPKFSGPNMQVRHVIGGRNLGMRFDIVSNQENPFFMRELTEFRCPTGP